MSLENKLIKLKEELSRRDLQVADLEFKENSVLNDNQNLMIENERLKNELRVVEDVLGDRVRELEKKLDEEGRNAEEAASRYDGEFQKFKKEGLEYVENLTQEYERKLRILDEKARAAETAKRGLVA